MYCIFIGGIQPKTRTLEDRPRMCPSCGLYQAFLKRTDHYLSLFFVPLFPVQKGTPFLECRSCGTISSETGEPLARKPPVCPYCGVAVEKAFRYCPSCGKPLHRRAGCREKPICGEKNMKMSRAETRRRGAVIYFKKPLRLCASARDSGELR